MSASAPPVHDGLFAIDDTGRPYLIGGRCTACGRLQFPRGSTCPACGGDGVDEVRLADHGTLWGWTAVTTPPPGYLGDVPFGFGVVELADGLRVITRIEEPDPARLEFGMTMRLTLVELHGPATDGPDADARDISSPVTSYTFVPAPDRGELAAEPPTQGGSHANAPDAG